MSILIKGMEMPKNCDECVCNYDSYCMVKSKSLLFVDSTKKLDDCPLVELLPHERFIDVEVLDAIRNEGIKIGAELAAMHGSDATTQELEKEYWHGYEDAMQKRDIKPVVHGKWVLKTFDDGYGEYQLYECGQCGAVTAQRKSKNYCHNCGAKMESEE